LQFQNPYFIFFVITQRCQIWIWNRFQFYFDPSNFSWFSRYWCEILWKCVQWLRR